MIAKARSGRPVGGSVYDRFAGPVRSLDEVADIMFARGWFPNRPHASTIHRIEEAALAKAKLAFLRLGNE